MFSFTAGSAGSWTIPATAARVFSVLSENVHCDDSQIQLHVRGYDQAPKRSAVTELGRQHKIHWNEINLLHVFLPSVEILKLRISL